MKYLVNIANIGETDLEKSTIEKWEITRPRLVGVDVFFNVYDTCMSMRIEEFNQIFKEVILE